MVGSPEVAQMSEDPTYACKIKYRGVHATLAARLTQASLASP